MRLHEFILTNRELILVEWEEFARSFVPVGTLDTEGLRDHANEMLTVIAADLVTPQSGSEQSRKSHGLGTGKVSAEPTAAEEHGVERAHSGFTIEQMVGEYRALRASVVRLWTEQKGQLQGKDVEDLIRFNEAVDQAVAESVFRFNDSVSNARDMFLGILGHDLRNPIGAIYTSAKFMLETDELEEPHRTLIMRIEKSASRTLKMVGDLLDFTRTRLGGEIPVQRSPLSLGRLVRDAVEEIKAAHPDTLIGVDTRSDKRGEWDGARLSQAFGNLIGNAVQHGAPGKPIRVSLSGDASEAIVTIHNFGPAIAEDQLRKIFEPMRREETPLTGETKGPLASLGLGLYIAERIINAHRGTITVTSDKEAGTTFTVHLPCRESAGDRKE